MLAKGDYIVVGGPPFIVAKTIATTHDETPFSWYDAAAELPTLTAAVMWAELDGAACQENGVFSPGALHRVVAMLNGGR